MHEPEIICPNCRHPIKLTESLAAPLIAETQARHKAELLNKELEYSKKADDLRKQQEDLAEARASFEDQLATRLNAERARIADAEAKKAKDFAALEMETKTKELEELRQVLAKNTQKLAEAQQAQADLLRKQRALDDATRELELTIETRVQGNLAEIRTMAQNEAQDALKLKLSEKDQQMAAMHKTIEELKRKAEQGSQQSQGEVFELELEELLRNRFPMDFIEPVAKGELGADLVQHVNAAAGQTAGIILWETKRTKAWSDGWLSKLKGDQRRSNADIALIVSHALPKHIETFDLMDGIWVAHPRCALPVATALRRSLIELAGTRLINHGQQTKMEQVYQYLTGTKFKQRVEAIIEKFNDMREDLDKERKFMNRQWAKRESQILGVVESTAGMVGDLQGIAGKAMPEIPALDLPLIDGPQGNVEAAND
jgi:hypothetical protein